MKTLLLGASLLFTGAFAEKVPGTLKPLKRIILSSKSEGVATSMAIAGQTFNKGQVLALIEDHILPLDLSRKAAQITSLQVERKFLTTQLADKQAQLKKGLINKDEVEDLKFRTAKLKSEIDVLKVESKTIKLKQNELKIIAPFSGVVTTTNKKDYEFIQRGEEVLEIINDQILLAKIAVTKVQKNKAIKVKVNGKFHVGHVHFISPEKEPASGLIEVHISIKNLQRSIKAGSRCEVHFE